MSTPIPGASLPPVPPVAQSSGAHAQSLALGAAGIALLHVERARRGNGSWTDVHAVLAACVQDLIVDDDASLYFGAPAVAFAVHTAAAGTDRYTTALHALDLRIINLTMRRVDQAHARIDRGERPRLGEFDLFYGLSGLGVYLSCRDPNAPALREVLSYLVRLTLPLPDDDDQLPGWWTSLNPSGSSSEAFAGGHGNLGVAHGISGVLSLLALATRQGAVVDGQIDAIRRICASLDLQRQDTSTGTWWPHWITLAEHRTGTVSQPGPQRPSWCYGTPGLARAQQLAGLALGDSARQHMAENALLSCLADPAQLDQIRDPSLCHGAAGLLHIAHRVARDAATDGFTAHLPRLRALLLDQKPAREAGFLEGATGPALVLLTHDAHGATASGWDACLLAG